MEGPGGIRARGEKVQIAVGELLIGGTCAPTAVPV